MLVMGVAEQDEDFDIGEAQVGEPLVDVMDLARAGGCVAARVLTAQVARLDRDLLEE